MTEQQPAKRGGGLMSAIRGGMEKVASGLSDPSSLQHTIRQQVATYNPKQSNDTLRLQLAIKSASGVVSDEEALSRELCMYSKNIFLWGKDEKGADLVDLTDRLAYLLYSSGELHKQHAVRLEQSRTSLKDIRNQENTLVPRRRAREALAARLQADKKGNDTMRMQSELEEMDKELATFEASLDALRRTKLHEAFSLHFSAQKELGEKQAILAGYGELLLRGMETDGYGAEYTGQERTARVKGELSEALAAWKPSQPRIPAPELKQGGSSYLGRADTQSFGSTHASELSQLHDDHSSSPNPLAHMPSASSPTPSHPRVLAPIPDNHALNTSSSDRSSLGEPRSSSAGSTSRPVPIPPTHHSNSGGIGASSSPSRLNLSPTPKDLGPSYSPSHSPVPVDPFETTDSGIPTGPTVAETGSPIVGTGGPSSGQLPVRPHAASHAHDSGEPPVHLASLGGFPSAEDEKRRLEQAQVEQARALQDVGRAGPSGGLVGGQGAVTSGGEDLPSYVDDFGESPQARADREAQQILAAERERKGASLV